MKVGLIGESVTMHYLDYYCEKHKDRIAGFSEQTVIIEIKRRKSNEC